MKAVFEKFFFNDTVEVLERKETGVYNDAEVTETVLATVKADVQPSVYKDNLLLKQYGLSEAYEKHMYYNGCENIKAGNYIRHNGVLYRIAHVIDRQMGSEAFLKVVE